MSLAPSEGRPYSHPAAGQLGSDVYFGILVVPFTEISTRTSVPSKNWLPAGPTSYRTRSTVSVVIVPLVKIADPPTSSISKLNGDAVPPVAGGMTGGTTGGVGVVVGVGVAETEELVSVPSSASSVLLLPHPGNTARDKIEIAISSFAFFMA